MKTFGFALVLIMVFTVAAYAHTPLMSCFDEGDGTVTCEGGFSDGSSASGVEFMVEQGSKTVLKTRLNEFSEINFEKPQGDYKAIFNAGEGHVVAINGKDIF